MTNPGDLVPYSAASAIARRTDDMNRTIREGLAARSLAASTIGAGGLTVKDGGSITIEGTGSLNVGSGALNSAGSITAGTNISAGGNMVAGGTVQGAAVASTGNITGVNVTASGTVTSSAPLVSPGSRAYNVVPAGGYAGLWADGSGKVGINPSGVEFKQDFEPADTTEIVDQILRVGLIRYRFIKEVELRGEDAPWHLGTIAQYMESGALSEWVSDTQVGKVINWEHIAIPLVAAVQRLHADALARDKRMEALAARLAALDGLAEPTA
jgi:hypothetical protein